MVSRGVTRAIAVVLLVGTLAAVGAGTALAWGPGPYGGMMGGAGWNGVMGGYGPTGGHCAGGGMMGGWWGANSQTQGQPISLDQAAKNVQAYVDGAGNKDLVVDEVMEFQDNFYAVVKEKSSGIGAFELLVNKYTGVVFPEMGPNMMWNTRYGMMTGGGMMGGRWGNQSGPNAQAGPLTVTAEQAKAAAQQWLDQNQPGSSPETPDAFYGYYTLHTLDRDGKVSGMLSVNGYTGQVWYHSWHGAFVQMKELSS